METHIRIDAHTPIDARISMETHIETHIESSPTRSV